jgi:hypothetical protein
MKPPCGSLNGAAPTLDRDMLRGERHDLIAWVEQEGETHGVVPSSGGDGVKAEEVLRHPSLLKGYAAEAAGQKKGGDPTDRPARIREPGRGLHLREASEPCTPVLRQVLEEMLEVASVHT